MIEVCGRDMRGPPGFAPSRDLPTAPDGPLRTTPPSAPTRNNTIRNGVTSSGVTMHERANCIECGDELPAERAELGYRYCTKAACQAVHHRGLAITTVGVNKSADRLVVADAEEVRRRGEAGEFGKKDTALGLDYRGTGAGRERTARRAPEPPASPRRRWTAQQETVVRLYHDMGLSPRQIAERAGRQTPRLGITERLAVQILSAAPLR
jgi:ribosomal protein L37AE/L43A